MPRPARPLAKLERYLRARDLGADYLVSRQRADGMIGDVEQSGLGGFYKAVWALRAAGRTAAAARLAGWVRRHGVTPEGDFAGEFSRGGLDQVYAYPNAWLIGGLHRLGAYDLSLSGMRFLRGLVDPRTGGLATQRGGPGPGVPQEVLSSAMAGLAALTTGDLDTASGVHAFLRRVLDAQPAPDRLLCHVYLPERGVVTQFAPEEAARFAVYADRPLQAYFMYGIGAAFCVRCAMAVQASQPEAARTALADAARFLMPAHNAYDAMYETAQVGKVAWGAALLAGCTGDAYERALAERAADALLDQQNPDGSWDNTGGYTTEGMRDEVTAEFVALLDEVAGALA
jgi:hypothetical protein